MFRRKKDNHTCTSPDKDERIKHLTSLNSIKDSIITAKDKQIEQLRETIELTKEPEGIV